MTRHDEALGVYRLYADDGELLYVGCSRDVSVRVDQHRVASPFGQLIHSVKSESFRNQALALAEESRLIRELRPHWNIIGRRPRANWSACDYYEVLESLKFREPTERNQARYERVLRQFRTRFPLVAELTGMAA